MTRSIAIPVPAIMIPVCPVATKPARTPRSSAARWSSSETVILPTAQSLPTVSTTRAGTRHAAPEKSGTSGGKRTSQIAAPLRAAAAANSGSSRNCSCKPLTISSFASSAARIAARQLGGNAPPGGATPTSSDVGS